MFAKRNQSGFTLVEILMVLSVIIILAGALIGIGKFVILRGQTQLCESQITVICTALEQYYDDYEAFPVTEKDITGDGNADAYDLDHLEYDLKGEVLPVTAFDDLNQEAPSSVLLYYCLHKGTNSRKIIQALSGDLVTNKDSGGIDIKLRPNGGAADGSDDVDLPRLIDPWGRSLRYKYADGAAFPIVTSAGPDGAFGTADDIKSQ